MLFERFHVKMLILNDFRNRFVLINSLNGIDVKFWRFSHMVDIEFNVSRNVPIATDVIETVISDNVPKNVLKIRRTRSKPLWSKATISSSPWV